MSDRFSGSINFGGQVTREQFDTLCELAEPCLELEGVLDEDGQAYFHECANNAFLDLEKYCKQHNIPLMIHWDSKYEYDGYREYWMDGNYKQYAANSYSIVIPLYQIQSIAAKAQHMTLLAFIDGLDIPELPNFSIAD